MGKLERRLAAIAFGALAAAGGGLGVPQPHAEDEKSDLSGLRLLRGDYHGYVDFRYDRTYADDAFEIVFEIDKKGGVVDAKYKIKTPGVTSSKQDANSYLEIRNFATKPHQGKDSRPGCPPPRLTSTWEQMTADEVEVAAGTIKVSGEQILPDIVIGLGLESCHGSGTEIKKGQTSRTGLFIHVPDDVLAQSATQPATFGGKGWKYPEWKFTLSPYKPASGSR